MTASVMAGQIERSILATQIRVLSALVLRDIKTRFFGNGLGYLVAIMWPFVHMALLLIIYTFADRVTPLGTSTLQFLAIGVVPVISFLYLSRFIMFSVHSNAPLLNFPIVKFVDLIIARAALEVAAALCVAVLMAAILLGLDVPILPANGMQAALAFLSTILCGIGAGAINGVIALKAPGWAVVYVLIGVILYASSGILFMPDAMPREIVAILAWNPLLHSVEWMREAYYEGYKSQVLDKAFLVETGGGMLFAALAIERGLRRFLLR